MSEDPEKAALIKKSLLHIQKLKKELAKQDEPIAIVGMACRFPGGSHNLEAYWEFLKNGEDGIIEVPENRWDSDRFYDPDPNVVGKMITKLAGFLKEDAGEFDAAFFNISPREAEYMDPQHRLLLEVSYEALESAGIAPSKLEGSLSAVFMGICNHDYMDRIIGTGNKALINPYMAIGNAGNAGVGSVIFLWFPRP